MRSASLALALLLFALSSWGQTWGETWTEPGRALPGALGGAYKMTVSFDLVSFYDLTDSRREWDAPVADEGGIVPSFRYYFTPVADTEKPYHLQPFLQQTSYLEGGFEVGPGAAALFVADGTFLLPGRPLAVTGELAFGRALLARKTNGQRFADEGGHFGIGGGVVYYLTADNNLALEGSLAVESTKGDVTVRYRNPSPPPNWLIEPLDWTVNRTTLLLGARWVTSIPQWGGLLEVSGGLRMARYDFKTNQPLWQGPANIGDDLIDLAVDARYFFNKQTFAGLKFATGSRLFGITAGYATDKGYQVELEWVGEGEIAGGLFRLNLGMRF